MSVSSFLRNIKNSLSPAILDYRKLLGLQPLLPSLILLPFTFLSGYLFHLRLPLRYLIVYHGVSVGISDPLNIALAIPDQLDLLSDVHDLGLRVLDFVVEGREIIKSWVLES